MNHTELIDFIVSVAHCDEDTALTISVGLYWMIDSYTVGQITEATGLSMRDVYSRYEYFRRNVGKGEMAYIITIECYMWQRNPAARAKELMALTRGHQAITDEKFRLFNLTVTPEDRFQYEQAKRDSVQFMKNYGKARNNEKRPCTNKNTTNTLTSTEA